MTVQRVTIHHEGAGDPTDDVRRFASGGYTIGVGVSRWERFRSVADSYGTLHYNGQSVDVAISGDRTAIPVTDTEIRMIGEAVTDCRNRGEVVAQPAVIAHRNSPGSNTVCPGDATMLRWDDVVVVCQGSHGAGEDDLLTAAVNKGGSAEVFRIAAGSVEHKWRDEKSGKWGPWVNMGGAGLVDVTAITNDDGRLELFGADAGGNVTHTWQVAPVGSWSPWVAL